MLDISSLKVYVNGSFVPGPDASISVFDRGFLYGDAVFEGIREYGGRVFKLDEHIDRLFESALVINLRMPLSKDALKGAVVETLRRNELRDAHIRTIVTRGRGEMGVDPGVSLTPTVIIFAHPWAPFLGASGIRMKTVAVRRVPPQSLDSRVKSVNYLNSVMAKIEARAAGADEALILDLNGYVTEGPGENFLIVKGGAVISPTTINILDGVTRRTALALATEAGFATLERNLTLGDVYTADEAFVTGTGCEIVPVVEVDGRPIGSGKPGPITLRLMTAFRELVSRAGTPVY
jgi:branched-chain amino acid aminotransferase